MILTVLSILGKQVRDNSGLCSYCWPKRHNSLCPTLEHPRRLDVYLLLAHGTRRQSHHKVVSRPTPKSNNGIPNGASFDTAITIELRFALLNVKCFSDFSLPLPCSVHDLLPSCPANRFHVASTVHGHARRWLTLSFVQV